LSRSAAQPNADEDDEDEDEQPGEKPRARGSPAAAKLPPTSRRQREPLLPKQTAPPTAPPSPPPIRRGSDIDDDFDDAFDDDAYDGGGPTRAAAPGTSFSAPSWAPGSMRAVG
jgi:hypothetical protein